MNLLVRPRVYIKIIWLKWKCWNISSVCGVNEVSGRLPTSNNNLVGCYGKNPFRRNCVTKMKRPGDELNFNEEEQGGKSRKTLNFTRADRDASPSSSIGDVAGPETAKDKCTGKLAPRNFSRKFSWWDTRSYSFESPDETATPGRVLVLYSFGKHTYDKKTGPFQHVRLVVNVDGSWSSQCQVQYKNIWLYISSRSNLKNRRMALLSILQRTFFALIKPCAWVFWNGHWHISPRISALWLGR